MTRAALDDTTLDDVACASTLCRMRVHLGNEQAVARLPGAIGRMVPWDTRATGHVDPADPSRYVVYVARDPEVFPGLSPAP